MKNLIRLFFMIILSFIAGCNGSNTSERSSTTTTVTVSMASTVPKGFPSSSSPATAPQATPLATLSPSFSSRYMKNYTDDEILSFVLKYSNLNETTIKLKDWPETNENQEQLKNPIFFVLVEKRPDSNSKEVDEKDYYKVYFGQNYGDHIARYLRIFVKNDLSEIVLSEDGLFEDRTKVIYP